MKKIVIILLLLFAGFLGFFLAKTYLQQNNSRIIPEKKVTPTKQINKISITSKSIFVPYWSFDSGNSDFSEYDSLIYFGIAPNYEGINKQEDGYKGLPAFIENSEGKKKFLTLRMIDYDVNTFVLENDAVQKKIIAETLDILEEYKFAGAVLDLEISNSLNKDISIQINNFVQQFYSEVNKNYRRFFVTIYGDTFYKKRPFDLSFLAKNSDGIMIMAYDFHKSRGEPGPNFPYTSGPASAEATAGRAKYPYNFKMMISDFLRFVPKEKLTVIFGMFGYDWLVDEKKRLIRQAEALSLNEMNKKFIEKCEFKNCVIKRDNISKETEINYIISSPTPDEQDIYRIDYHIVWFEDEESVKTKTVYLRDQEISNISYWAYGYF